jgi:putative polyhydroxyalkanoate system protein
VSHIFIHREHGLPHARAIDAANRIATRLENEYGVLSRWEGSILRFERTGLSGKLALSGSELELEIQLGFLMSVFRERISQAIEQTLHAEFPSKPARAPRRKSPKI